MAMKLYGSALSTCTTRVMTCLIEKGVEFELIHVDLHTKEHKQPSFLAKNPFGSIPVLEDGDLTLFESRAMTAYITEKHKETGFDLTRHNDTKESALVKVWLEVEAHRYNPAISPIFVQCIIAPLRGQSPDQKIVEASLEELERVLDIYEARLSCSKYLAGDFYSLADLHHLPYTHYFMETEYAYVVNDRPHVKAWWEDISTRDAFLKVKKGMGFGKK